MQHPLTAEQLPSPALPLSLSAMARLLLAVRRARRNLNHVAARAFAGVRPAALGRGRPLVPQLQLSPQRWPRWRPRCRAGGGAEQCGVRPFAQPRRLALVTKTLSRKRNSELALGPAKQLLNVGPRMLGPRPHRRWPRPVELARTGPTLGLQRLSDGRSGSVRGSLPTWPTGPWCLARNSCAKIYGG